MTNRRTFIKTTGLSLAAFSIPVVGHSSKFNKLADTTIKLGIASYSLRAFSMEEALDMSVRCSINRISFKSMHLPLDSTDEAIKNAVKVCKEKSIKLYGGGVIYMKTKEEVDQTFHYAKTAEMDMIIGVPNHELLGYVEEKVKEYDIKLAIHNHGPGDKLYPSAQSAFEKIKNMDKRLGLCLDIGHTTRIDRDPGDDLKNYFDRVFDVHLKDITASVPDGKTCIIGHGVIDIPKFLHTVVDLGYQGTLALEYEADEKDPLPGIMESLGYARGVLSTF